jgi:hypothetical protein
VLDLSRGIAGTTLKVIVSLNGARIEGAASAPAIVVLADSLEDIQANDVKSAPVAAGKKYRFTGLHPGKYRLIVVDRSQVYSTDTLLDLYPKAPEIEIHEGDRITRDVETDAAH